MVAAERALVAAERVRLRIAVSNGARPGSLRCHERAIELHERAIAVHQEAGRLQRTHIEHLQALIPAAATIG